MPPFVDSPVLAAIPGTCGEPDRKGRVIESLSWCPPLSRTVSCCCVSLLSADRRCFFSSARSSLLPASWLASFAVLRFSATSFSCSWACWLCGRSCQRWRWNVLYWRGGRCGGRRRDMGPTRHTQITWRCSCFWSDVGSLLLAFAAAAADARAPLRTPALELELPEPDDRVVPGVDWASAAASVGVAGGGAGRRWTNDMKAVVE